MLEAMSKGANGSVDALPRNPMTGITACWARTASGYAAVRHFNRVELHPAPNEPKPDAEYRTAQICRIAE
jgi:hypothetical protein